MENEALGVELKEDQKTHVKFMSEIAKSTLDTPTVLKGGTALLLAYDLDRFSEDLDFDSTKAFNLEKRVNDSAKKSNVKVNKIFLKKDTSTTKRYVVNYTSEQGKRRLKIETIFQQVARAYQYSFFFSLPLN
jgi:predicted nucleotidyltransferase component of viral defense system